MWKRYLFSFILIITAGIISLPWWFSPKQITEFANQFLSPDYHIQISDQSQLHFSALTLPTLQIQTPKCQLLELTDVRLTWWSWRRIAVENARLDYACLKQLPESNEKNEFNLAALLSWLPKSEVAISHFQLDHSEHLASQLQPLLQSDLAANLIYDGKNLYFHTTATQQSAVIFQQYFQLSPNNKGFVLRGKGSYQPADFQLYHFDFQTQLNRDFSELPNSGALSLGWQNPDLIVKQGALWLQWEGNKIHLQAQDWQHNVSLANIPIEISEQGIVINWGRVGFSLDDYPPTQGVLWLNLKKTSAQWLPLNTNFRLMLHSYDSDGKGNMVIATENGEIGGGSNQDQLALEIQATGEWQDSHTTTSLNLNHHIGGEFSHPILLFRKDAMFKMDKVEPDTQLHVNLPLNDVLIGKYGLEGRLQASLKGSSPQFSHYDLTLDGQAHEFIAGVKTVFELRDTHRSFQNIEQQAANRWNWNIQGNLGLRALKTNVALKGVGFWENDHIELTELSAQSGAVNIDGVKMSPISLVLKDRLRWDYEKETFRGLVQAKTKWIEFAYGGRFDNPVLGVGLNGKSINHFGLAGDLKSGSLGPLDIQADYADQALLGKISWKRQSAKVFQSLFPKKWEWLIHQGSIKGATDFTINSNGVMMNGELWLQNGEISLPDGEIQGLDIHFPLHYQEFALHTSQRQPIQISAQKVRTGALQIDQMKFNVAGHYPYSKLQPLQLRDLSMGIFDGKLSLDELNFPQQKIALLKLQQIDLGRVLDMAQYGHIQMKGRIDANLPFWVSHSDCLICGGTMTKASPLNVRLNEEMVKGLKSGGWTESILVDVIKNMDLTDLYADLTLKPTGDMILAATLIGYNPDKKTHNPIRLNYQHRENMFELWDMIDYGSQFEQNLEYRLYQQLQK